MGTLLTNPSRTGQRTDAKSIFERFAEQIEASVNEFNRLRGGGGLQCEWTPNRIAVSKEAYPRVTVELEYDETAGTIRMTRQKLEQPSTGAVLSDLRCTVDRNNQVYL